MTDHDVLTPTGPLAWMTGALCARVDPELFYPDKGASTWAAQQVCAACPVRVQCLAYALAHGERFGVWGGTSERERRELAGPRTGRAPAQPVRARAAQIRRLAAAGLTDGQVGERIGCTARTVLRLRTRFGIPPSRPRWGDTRGAA